MDLSVKLDSSSLHAQGYSQYARRKMSLNYASQGEGEARSGGSPPYSSSNDTFPYGLSGVSMPNYGYPGDLYQFTSNGYPRKSRTCCYCGKVFTRSTTRRYHEKRCPLLRAAVCGIMPDNGKRLAGPGMGVPPGLSHAVDKASATSMSGVGHLPAPHLPTSHLASPLSMVLKREHNGIGYHPSVIVKQDSHDLNGTRPTHQSGLGLALGGDAALDLDSNMTRLTPDSDGSSPRPQKLGDVTPFSLSPFQGHSGLSFSKSPSQGSVKGEVNSPANEDGEKENLKNDLENGSDLDIPDAETFQERMKDDEARANDLNFTSPGRGDASLLDGTTSSNMGDPSGALSDEEKTVTDKSKGYLDGECKCSVCGKGFESPWQLHVHEQIHKKFKPYACRFCNQRFSKAALRIAHEREHSVEECKCAICGSSLIGKEALQLHILSRHRDGPWLCRYCGKAEITHQEMFDHLQSHDLPKEELLSLSYFLASPLDNANNDSDNNLNDSELNEIDNLNDSELVSMSDSNDNMTSPGQESPGDNMAAVEQEMMSPAEMMSSAEMMAPADMMSSQDMMSQEKEMCTICGRDYPKSHMAYHKKAHEGHKPYECPICGKRFGYKNNMKSHIKLHAGIKPYQCNVCGAKFTRGSTLRRHARRHGISAESVWDLFVRNGSSSQTTNQMLTPIKHDTSSPPTLPTPKDLLTSNGSYGNLFSTPTSAAMSNALLMSYHNHQAAVAASLPSFYPPLQQHTSDGPAPALGFASSHTPQKDALNLTTQKSIATGPADGLHRSLTDSISPTSMERSRSRSLSGSDISRPTPISAPIRETNNMDIGIQVKMCCKMGLEPTLSGAQSPSEASVHSGDSGAMYQAQSSSAGLDNSTDSIATLMGSGRLFKCDHCECYFSEYAMYRIHTKIHAGGRTMPFVCPVCGEDCHDRVYFSLHISEHLR